VWWLFERRRRQPVAVLPVAAEITPWPPAWWVVQLDHRLKPIHPTTHVVTTALHNKSKSNLTSGRIAAAANN